MAGVGGRYTIQSGIWLAPKENGLKQYVISALDTNKPSLLQKFE